jgi:hypothetical protein
MKTEAEVAADSNNADASPEVNKTPVASHHTVVSYLVIVMVMALAL